MSHVCITLALKIMFSEETSASSTKGGNREED